MKNSDEPRPLKTLKGFFEGQEPETEIYFNYSATLRILGDIEDLEQIGATLGVKSTVSHRKGERRGLNSAHYQQDMWSYESGLDENEPLHKHLEALWRVFKPRKQELLELKKRSDIDVFCGYRSNCDHCGVDLSPKSLEIFVQLQIPYRLSMLVI